MGEFDLKDFGYLAGQYLHKHCGVCNEAFTGDKRATACRKCATDLWCAHETEVTIDVNISTAKRSYRVELKQGSISIVRTGTVSEVNLPVTQLYGFVGRVVEGALEYLESERKKQLELTLTADQKRSGI